MDNYTTQGYGEYTVLTEQLLHESLAQIKPHDDFPERVEVSPNTEREIRARFSPALYTPPSPNTILGSYSGIKIVVNEDLPDGYIIFVYRTPRGERRELKIFAGCK
uniref:Uncharacterized protein n=1 Tax=viral metagenome TaxID=1070528 RepID=A0A6M3LBL3_9ZZZZ